jgi:hypothetical protein
MAPGQLGVGFDPIDAAAGKIDFQVEPGFCIPHVPRPLSLRVSFGPDRRIVFLVIGIPVPLSGICRFGQLISVKLVRIAG